MVDFKQLFEAVLSHMDNTRTYFAGGYPSRFKFYEGKVFVATVDDEDKPQLDVYDMEKFSEIVVILVQMFCEEKGLSSFDEILKHEEYSDFMESLIEGVYQMESA